jgi:hypothetical protein
VTGAGAKSGAFAAHNKKALFTEVELLYHSIPPVSRAFLYFFAYSTQKCVFFGVFLDLIVIFS